MSEIPEDVMARGKEVLIALDDAMGWRESCQIIAHAIMAERERCAKALEAAAEESEVQPYWSTMHHAAALVRGTPPNDRTDTA